MSHLHDKSISFRWYQMLIKKKISERAKREKEQLNMKKG